MQINSTPNPFAHMRRELDRMFGMPADTPRRALEDHPMPMDLHESETAYRILLELPGVTEAGLSVRVEERKLIVEAKREEIETEGWRVHGRQLGHGTLKRVFALPEQVDAEGISARLLDGILTLQLPKQAAIKPRQIPIARD